MDFLGNDITPGSIVIMSGTKQSGFEFGIVERVTKGRVFLTSSYPSRKEKDNVIVITEEQLINSITSFWQNRADEDGNFVQRVWDRNAEPGGRYVEVKTPAEEKAFNQYSSLIFESRRIKGEPLEEFENLND